MNNTTFLSFNMFLTCFGRYVYQKIEKEKKMEKMAPPRARTAEWLNNRKDKREC